MTKKKPPTDSVFYLGAIPIMEELQGVGGRGANTFIYKRILKAKWDRGLRRT